MKIVELNNCIDFNQIIDLYFDAGWDLYTNDQGLLNQAYKNSLKSYVVVEEDKLLGVIRIVGDGISIIYIQDIIVRSSHQRKGIGSILLKKVLDEYQTVRQIVLLTDEQEKTKKFYEANGFKSTNDMNCVSFVQFR